MEGLLKSLRQFYLMASVPPLAFFALFFFAADEPLCDARMSYMLCFFVYLAAFVSVLATHAYMTHTEKKMADMDEEQAILKFAKAYKVRIVTLNVVSFFSSLAYFITVVESCYYMTLILTLLILLSYPSRQYILRDND